MQSTKSQIAAEMDRIAAAYSSYETAPQHIKARWDDLNNQYSLAKR